MQTDTRNNMVNELNSMILGISDSASKVLLLNVVNLIHQMVIQHQYQQNIIQIMIKQMQQYIYKKRLEVKKQENIWKKKNKTRQRYLSK